MANEIVTGQLRSWNLIEKLGEGDAGEVYLVESLFDQQRAILKRPYRGAFTSDVNRQAAQIATEADILRTLNGLNLTVDWPNPSNAIRIHTPSVLDSSKSGNEFSDRYFIVIEKAHGFDLDSLARMTRLGHIEHSSYSQEIQQALEIIVKSERIPDLILLRALAGTLALFDHIHGFRPEQIGDSIFGLIWNDIKPAHLFWDPQDKCLTIIDWGNGQFLELDGTTSDFRFTRISDYSQFIHEMGQFLVEHAPNLHTQLDWPPGAIRAFDFPDLMPTIREKVAETLSYSLRELNAIRQLENNLVLTSYPAISQVAELEVVREKITLFGEIPDHVGAQKFCLHLASRLVNEGRLTEFREHCTRSRHVPEADIDKWLFLDNMAQIAIQLDQSISTPKQFKAFIHAIHSGLMDDWPTALWSILSTARNRPEPAWWDDIARGIRQLEFGVDPSVPTPYVTVKRVLHTLQSASIQLEDTQTRSGQSARIAPTDATDQSYTPIIEALRDSIVKQWNIIDPDPPDSGIEYTDIERLVSEISELQPSAHETIVRSLEQPRAQVKIVMDSWGRKEFEAARRGLHYILLWDPDRRRLFQADRAIQATPTWLGAISQGPRRDQTLQEYITPLELEGRELRNQVGPARWLDLILDTLTRLRKGANPTDLVFDKPELKTELPWLVDLAPPRPLRTLSSESVRLERQIQPSTSERVVRGIQEARAGKNQAVQLGESLDTWVAESRGSSARVFAGNLRTQNSQVRACAIKIMRSDRIDYALPLFREEIQILALMRDVPGITPLLECGYLQLEDGQALPADTRSISAENLTGKVIRYAPEEIVSYLAELEQRAHNGWLPYLTIDRYSQTDNLLQFCDTGHTHGRYLPIDALLCMAIQICDILEVAHARNTVYRDHKILHYYWLESHNGIFLIDWNVAKRHPHGLSAEEKQFDLVQFGARALHHIFTGRPAPGALPLGPTRPEEIEAAAHSYKAQWTYDDQRLPTVLKEIIEKNLAGGYTQVRDLRYDLFQVFQQMTSPG